MFIRFPERVVGDGDDNVTNSHEQKSYDLDSDSTKAIDEEDGDPVARNGGTDSYDGLESGLIEGLMINVIGGILVVGKELGVDFGLEEIAAVEHNVDQEPRGGT